MRQIQSLQKEGFEVVSPISVSVDFGALRRSENPEQRQFAQLLQEVADLKSGFLSLEKNVSQSLEKNTSDLRKIFPELEEARLVRQIIESASTRALGCILEQHCKLQLTDSTLEVIFQGNNRMAHELLHEDETLQTIQQIVHAVLGRDMKVRIIDAPTHKR